MIYSEKIPFPPLSIKVRISERKWEFKSPSGDPQDSWLGRRKFKLPTYFHDEELWEMEGQLWASESEQRHKVKPTWL